MSTENIFDRACLIQLSTPCWTGSKQLQPSVMEQVGDSDWVKGRKVLIDPETLSPIKAAVSKARTFLKKVALPFPINGLTLVSKEALSRLELGLRDIQYEYNAAVESFLADYETARLKARNALGDLFDEADYPAIDDIRKKFGFEWRYVTLSMPGRSMLLSPELYEREKAKFTSLMEETREIAVLALREEFQSTISHLVDRLSENDDGKPKVIRNDMLNRLNEFLESFQSRNLFDDSELADLANQARQIVNGISDPAILKEPGFLRQRVSEEMNRLKDSIDTAVESLPRRKIRFAA